MQRAELRAMHLLTRMDYTEAELEKKLLQAEYTPEAVKNAIDYVRSYEYINDARYVARYLSAFRMETRSRQKILSELQR